jgi:hypothetical protein
MILKNMYMYGTRGLGFQLESTRGMKIHFTGFIRSFIIVGALKSRTSSHGHVQVQHL